MSTTYTTYTDAIQREILEPLAACDGVNDAATEFDIEAIADEVFEWDTDRGGFRLVEDVDFWEVVWRHSTEAPAPVLSDSDWTPARPNDLSVGQVAEVNGQKGTITELSLRPDRTALVGWAWHMVTVTWYVGDGEDTSSLRVPIEGADIRVPVKP